MVDILKRLQRLIDVKSIVTLALTVVFSVLQFKGQVDAEQFLTVFTVIISFYFGTQAVKKQDSNSEKGDNTNENLRG